MEGKPKMSEQWRKLLDEQPRAPVPTQKNEDSLALHEATANLEQEIDSLREKLTIREDEIAELKVHNRDLEADISKREAEKQYVPKTDVAEKLAKARERVGTLEEELKTLSLQLNNVEKERNEAWQEVRDIHEAAAGGVHTLLRDIETRLSAYAEQRAANPSVTLVHMILDDEHLNADLRAVLREILAKYINN